MTYAESYDAPSRFGTGVQIDQAEIERILRRLISKQSADISASNARQLLGESLEGLRTGQVEFAKRLARISAEQTRRAEKLRIRHKRISRARRIALLTMVVAINLPIFM